MSARGAPVNIEQLADRVHSEFAEMPGLRLTMLQAQRLWNLDRDACEKVVDLLVGRTVLQRVNGNISLVSL
jgi:hypothetical protein